MESFICHWFSTRVMYFKECLPCIIGKCEFILGELDRKFQISSFFSARNTVKKNYRFHFWGTSPPKFPNWTIFVGLKLPLCDEQLAEMKQWHGLTMNKLFETMECDDFSTRMMPCKVFLLMLENWMPLIYGYTKLDVIIWCTLKVYVKGIKISILASKPTFFMFFLFFIFWANCLY